jgi:hypothetical protein
MDGIGRGRNLPARRGKRNSVSWAAHGRRRWRCARGSFRGRIIFIEKMKNLRTRLRPSRKPLGVKGRAGIFEGHPKALEAKCVAPDQGVAPCCGDPSTTLGMTMGSGQAVMSGLKVQPLSCHPATAKTADGREREGWGTRQMAGLKHAGVEHGTGATFKIEVVSRRQRGACDRPATWRRCPRPCPCPDRPTGRFPEHARPLREWR